MMIVESVSNPLVVPWYTDWAWGAPLIALTVIIHVLGLALIRQKFVGTFRHANRRNQATLFAVVLGGTTFLATALHAVEAALWAAVYCGLNAISEYKSAMLYSLNAMTSYGHTNLKLEERWYLMGAMEALNGWILFGTHDGLSVRCD